MKLAVLSLVVLGSAAVAPAADQPPICKIKPPQSPLPIGEPVTFLGGGRDPEGKDIAYSWFFGGGVDAAISGISPSNVPFSATVTFDVGGQAFPVILTVTDAAGQRGLCNVSVLVGRPPRFDRPAVPQQPPPPKPFTANHSVLAFNDLGMHCADLGSAPFSILPPFNVLNAQVVLRGDRPVLLDDSDLALRYSASASSKDPVIFDATREPPSINSTSQNYPVGVPADLAEVRKTDFWDRLDPADPDSPTIVSVLFGQDPPPDEGLATIHNVDGVGRRMPGIPEPYVQNQPQPFSTYQTEFGWFKAEGIPITAIDDYGRMNSYPLMRVQAVRKSTGQVLSAVDAVVPVSTEVDCRDCHARGQVGADPTARAADLGFIPAEDPGNRVSEERAAKTNILLLHDFEHHIGDDGLPRYDPPLNGRGTVLCAGCHNSYALEEVTGGGLPGDPTLPRMSEVMHGFHGELKVLEANGELVRDEAGEPVLSIFLGPGEARLLPVDPMDPNIRMEQNCFTCHPGKITQCFRGAMFTAGLKCSNCHGDMLAMGGVFDGDFDHTGVPADARQRLPWRDEPRCESCHRGDAVNPGKNSMLVRLAYDINDPAAVARLAPNKRFAENTSIDPETGKTLFDLYRNSRDAHGGNGRNSGIACEACHGSPHAIWANRLPYANDNITASELQGHRGTVLECQVCHLAGSFPNGTLSGPHGMHTVGDKNWIKSDGGWHRTFAEDWSKGDPCAACHGVDHLGTDLSTTPVDRDLRDAEGKLWARVKAGQVIACNLCHSLEDSFP